MELQLTGNQSCMGFQSFTGVADPVFDGREGSATGLLAYRLALRPPVSVAAKLLDEATALALNYALPIPAPVMPVIAVLDFWAKEYMEETLIRWVQRICSNQSAFPVMLNNFGGYPPQTIYLRVQDPLPIYSLASQLKLVDEYIRSNGCPAARFVSRPHFGIAPKLPPAIYEQAIPDYSRRLFSESFLASELILIRYEHSGDPGKLINIFKLRIETTPFIHE